MRLERLSKSEAKALLELKVERYNVTADEPEVYRRKVLELAQGSPFELERLVKYHSSQSIVRTKDLGGYSQQSFVERDEKGVALAPLAARLRGGRDCHALCRAGRKVTWTSTSSAASRLRFSSWWDRSLESRSNREVLRRKMKEKRRKISAVVISALLSFLYGADKPRDAVYARMSWGYSSSLFQSPTTNDVEVAQAALQLGIGEGRDAVHGAAQRGVDGERGGGRCKGTYTDKPARTTASA